MAAQHASDEGNSNFRVDYVIRYLVPAKERDQAEAAFVQLIDSLTAAGFATEVRPGGDRASLLVFVRVASDQLLRAHVYSYRLQDWLYGIRTTAPPTRNSHAVGSGSGSGAVSVSGSGSGSGSAAPPDLVAYFAEEPISEAERLRLVYQMISKPKTEGGAGISIQSGTAAAVATTASPGHSKYVAAIFPLHDHAFNRAWIKQWSTKYMLDAADLDAIRDKFGEKIAFYFAFLQSYFVFLLFPAAFGFGAWLLLGQFSWLYATVNCLWSVVFFEYWKKKEVDLAVQWGVRGVSKIQTPRPQFVFEREALDPVTGERVKIYSPFRRLAYQMLQLPFALACVVALGSMIALCFAIEIFITEVYSGPFKQYLTFLPTILLTVFMPVITAMLTSVAERLNNLENHETQDAHQAAFVQKIFVLNFITSYLPIFLTAFVYLPFGKVLVPYLDVFRITAQRLTGDSDMVNTSDSTGNITSSSSGTKLEAEAAPIGFQINPDRLTKQVIYFTVTAQVVNFLLEVIVPYVKRRVFRAVKNVKEEISSRNSTAAATAADAKDDPDEAAFLERVRNEAALDVYDVTIDYREMIVQFGYLSLFSAIWPLTACSFLVNNWVEARGDAMKIAIGSQRPIPWRGDSIGPWLTPLGFLSWLGSVTSAAVVYLFRLNPHRIDGSPWDIKVWALLLSILFAEHVYLVVQVVVRYVVEKLDSPGLQRERAERFALRKQVLAESLGTAELEKAVGGSAVGTSEQMNRDTLEAEAQQAGAKTPEIKFWLRQRGPSETVEVGRALISELRESTK